MSPAYLASHYMHQALKPVCKELKKTIRTNPGAALTVSSPALSIAQAKHSWAYEHRMCLNSRAGLILKKNTILKSYVFPEMQTDYLDQLPDVINYHKVGFGVPIATASAPTMAGMRQILADLGAAVEAAGVCTPEPRRAHPGAKRRRSQSTNGLTTPAFFCFATSVANS